MVHLLGFSEEKRFVWDLSEIVDEKGKDSNQERKRRENDEKMACTYGNKSEEATEWL